MAPRPAPLVEVGDAAAPSNDSSIGANGHDAELGDARGQTVSLCRHVFFKSGGAGGNSPSLNGSGSIPVVINHEADVHA